MSSYVTSVNGKTFNSSMFLNKKKEPLKINHKAYYSLKRSPVILAYTMNTDDQTHLLVVVVLRRGRYRSVRAGIYEGLDDNWKGKETAYPTCKSMEN